MDIGIPRVTAFNFAERRFNLSKSRVRMTLAFTIMLVMFSCCCCSCCVADKGAGVSFPERGAVQPELFDHPLSSIAPGLQVIKLMTCIVGL